MKKLFCVSALLAAVWIGSAAGAGLCARAYEVERTVISEKTAVIDGKPSRCGSAASEKPILRR